MAKAASKTRKTAAKSKPAMAARAKAAPPATARKALKKSLAEGAAKPAPKPVGAAIAGKAATAATKSGKWVFTFGGGRAKGKAALRDWRGGRGATLAERPNRALPVPPGFTIPTSV